MLVGSAVFLTNHLLIHKGLAWTAELATVCGFVAAAVGTVATTWRKWWKAPVPVSQLTVDQAIGRLARSLAAQWARRNAERQVHDPGPMQVRFTLTEFAQSVMTTVSLGSDSISTTPSARNFAGEFHDIFAVFLKIPTRRLVITGPAGSGKSVLAIKLASDILAARQSNADHDTSGPIPLTNVLPLVLPAARWKSSYSLREWIAAELVNIDHDLALRPRDTSDGATTLAQVIASQYVLPIIDGIDELPAQIRGNAITKINEVGSDQALVVTSRPGEYAKAIAVAGREVSRGAVVEMIPLTIAAVEEYLTESSVPALLPRWRVVFNRLTTEPDGPLAATLTNPLMLWLCRMVYKDGNLNPADLAVKGSNTGRRVIENHLLDAFLPAIYDHGYDVTAPRSYTSAKAQQALGFLAAFLGQTQTSDIAWWRLRREVIGWRVITAAIRGALLSYVLWRLAEWVLQRHDDWRNGRYAGRVGLESLLLTGPLSATIRTTINKVIAQAQMPHPQMQHRSLVHFFHSVTDAVSAITSVTSLPMFMLKSALVFAIFSVGSNIVWDTSNAASPVSLSLSWRNLGRWLGSLALPGAFIAFVVWAFVQAQTYAPMHVRVKTQDLAVVGLLIFELVVVFVLFVRPGRFFVSKTDVYGALTPVEVLRKDRMAACLVVIMRGAIFVAVVWLCSGPILGLAVGLLCLTGLVCRLILGSIGGWASSVFVDTRILLALINRMPLRTLTFLEDAHTRGALGRGGAVYQFRHLRLQLRLTEGRATWLGRVAESNFGSRILRHLDVVPDSRAGWAHPIWAERFQEQAWAVADVVGEMKPIGPIYREGPGVVQRFGTPDGRDWLICSLPRIPPVIVSDSVWDALRDVGLAEGSADPLNTTGFPFMSDEVPAGQRIVLSDAAELTLRGGALGPAQIVRDIDTHQWRREPIWSISSHKYPLVVKHMGVGTKVVLPLSLHRSPITKQTRHKLEEKLASSELRNTMTDLLPGQRVSQFAWSSSWIAGLLSWRKHVGYTYVGYSGQIRRSGSASVLRAKLRARLIRDPPLRLVVKVRVSIIDETGRELATTRTLSAPDREPSLSADQLQALLLSAWQMAADIVPTTILGNEATALLAHPPSIDLSIFLSDTEWRTSITGQVIGLTDDERLGLVQDAISYVGSDG